jgi:glyoxylate reductase
MTMGILGLGRIGSAMARRAKGFDMSVIYHTRHGRNIELDKQLDAKYVDMGKLIEESDFLSLHCPLNTGTCLTSLHSAFIAAPLRC